MLDDELGIFLSKFLFKSLTKNILANIIDRSSKKIDGDTMEKLLDITMMYDYYGKLLTERERDVIDKYYNEDLSLKEIADINGVSKQAVASSLKRAEKKLYDYEEKLSLIKKSNRSTFFLEKIYDDLSKVSQANDNKEIGEILDEIRDFLTSLEDV